MQEIGGKIALDARIKNNPTQAEQIMYWRNMNIPDYVIEESYATYHRWANPATPGVAFRSPDEMIISWMRGAGYQL